MPAARGAASGDMARILSALGYMRAVEPDRPVVVLLGGSAARESTISDAAWREQIERKGGPATLAWNMGSRNRTMAQNIAIVNGKPVPIAKFEGVMNLVRAEAARSGQPIPPEALPPGLAPED